MTYRTHGWDHDLTDKFPSAYIKKITIIDGSRVAVVTAPNGDRNTHGLGPVGEPLRLGHRSEGYLLALPEDFHKVRVVFVDTDREPNARGFFPKREVPWSWLEDPERPERD